MRSRFYRMWTSSDRYDRVSFLTWLAAASGSASIGALACFYDEKQGALISRTEKNKVDSPAGAGLFRSPSSSVDCGPSESKTTPSVPSC